MVSHHYKMGVQRETEKSQGTIGQQSQKGQNLGTKDSLDLPKEQVGDDPQTPNVTLFVVRSSKDLGCTRVWCSNLLMMDFA